MNEKKWLDGYDGQSVEQLLGMEDEYRIDSLVLAFEEALQAQADTRKLTNEEWIVLAVEALEREVNNGGYSQFFENTPEYLPIILDSLDRIGHPEAKAVTADAIGYLGPDGPTPEGISEEIFESLNGCDTRYFSSVGDLSVPLFTFIKNNRDKYSL